MPRNAQCAPMWKTFSSMFLEMLATESRMVVHIEIGTIDSLVSGLPSINVEDRFNP